MEDWDLSTGKREMGGGLERYTFQLPATFFKQKDVTPDILKQKLCGVYCISPRPDPREIVDIGVELKGRAARVTLTIQRGHYALARLVLEHEELTFKREEGYATCSCHPKTRHPLVMASIPNYRKELG